MTKTVLQRAVFAAVLGLMAIGGGNAARAQGGCGVEPPEVKPITAIGCRDMVHQCACGSNGCYWVWVCVR
jgi:hypothetical protein